MKIQILLFAHLREAAGFEMKTLEVTAGSTVGAIARNVFSTTLKKFSGSPVRFAVNEDFVSEETRLREGDGLAFIPPVAGG